MKINRVESKHPRLNKLKESALGNLLAFFYLHWLLLATIIGLTLSCAVLLFFAEMIFPDTVHMYNYAMTRNAFDELRNQKHYHAAAFVMEQNPQFLKEADDGIEYQMELSDVYSHIGEYSKAEAILLGIYNMDDEAYTHFKQLKSEDEEQLKYIMPMLKASTAVALTDLYEKMGDTARQRMFYIVSERAYNDFAKIDVDDIVDGMDEDEAEEVASMIYKSRSASRTTQLLRGLKVKYNEDRLQAIIGLANVVDTIWDKSNYNSAFKLKHISQLVDWKLQNGYKIGAYPYLYMGAELIYATKNLYDPAFEYAGSLAQAAFNVGDSDNGYKLMRLYQRYIEKNYSKDDIERLKGMLLICRYLDSQNDSEKLAETLTDICGRMKNEITKNFVGLSTDQREMLVKSLREPFDFAIEMASKYQTPALANLCFDNLIFERGLLMRSDALLRQSVSRDSEMAKVYQQWIMDSRELATREKMSGIGNVVRIRQLKSSIAEADKKLSKYEGFTSVRNLDLPNRKKIQSSLTDNGVFVEFAQHPIGKDTLLYAIMLPSKGEAKFVNLCNYSQVRNELKRGINDVYTDPTLTDKLTGKLTKNLPSEANIYYTTSGVFSQMAIPALCVSYSGNRYLADNYNFSLFSAPSEVADKHKAAALDAGTSITLWGGIDYGEMPADSVSSTLSMRGISRGEPLHYLPGSKNEIERINHLLTAHGLHPKTFTGLDASKKSFLGQNAGLIHISTHGSFDASYRGNPLTSSVLFFAGANPSWANLQPMTAEEKGIVNGLDISSMNLSDCELVVLSACETGLGYIDSREGVYGLQRAFKLAGADKVMMSMWSVSDAVTSDFMVAFYENLLSDSEPNPEKALRKAQRQIRRLHPMPSDWGAFVIMN